MPPISKGPDEGNKVASGVVDPLTGIITEIGLRSIYFQLSDCEREAVLIHEIMHYLGYGEGGAEAAEWIYAKWLLGDPDCARKFMIHFRAWKSNVDTLSPQEVMKEGETIDFFESLLPNPFDDNPPGPTTPPETGPNGPTTPNSGAVAAIAVWPGPASSAKKGASVQNPFLGPGAIGYNNLDISHVQVLANGISLPMTQPVGFNSDVAAYDMVTHRAAAALRVNHLTTVGKEH